jgi:membrane associated rhomboid family serine protease
LIPVGDSVRARTFPFVNVAIIALNILFFLYELTLSTTTGPLQPFSELDRFFFEWGSVPACLGDAFGFEPDVSPEELAVVCEVNNSPLQTALASMFLHGGWLHLIGNMVFLWVFGDNVEDAMGHVRYGIFYLIGGFAATAAHTFVSQNELIPAIGASGAISAVLGAYIVLFPRASITAIIPIFFFIPFQVSALFLIGLWFVMQLFNGIVGLTAAVGEGGVAWFAHIGGFVAGVLLVKLFVLGRRVPPAPRPAAGWRRQRDWNW